MLSLSLISRLEHQHESLHEMIGDLPDPALRQQVIAGKWSIFENIVHLQTYQHTFISRINRITEGTRPLFSAYVAEADPLFHDNCNSTVQEILEDLQITRGEIYRVITSLGHDDLQKNATHPAYGDLSLTQWLHFFLLHEAHHLLTIFKLAAQISKTSKAV